MVLNCQHILQAIRWQDNIIWGNGFLSEHGGYYSCRLAKLRTHLTADGNTMRHKSVLTRVPNPPSRWASAQLGFITNRHGSNLPKAGRCSPTERKRNHKENKVSQLLKVLNTHAKKTDIVRSSNVANFEHQVYIAKWSLNRRFFFLTNFSLFEFQGVHGVEWLVDLRTAMIATTATCREPQLCPSWHPARGT